MEDKQLDSLINEQIEHQKAIRQEQENLKIDNIPFQKECLEIFDKTKDTKPEELNQKLKGLAQGNPQLQKEVEDICGLIDEYCNTANDLQKQNPERYGDWWEKQIKQIEEILKQHCPQFYIKLTDIIDILFKGNQKSAESTSSTPL